jgi:hypothetical protein
MMYHTTTGRAKSINQKCEFLKNRGVFLLFLKYGKNCLYINGEMCRFFSSEFPDEKRPRLDENGRAAYTGTNRIGREAASTDG